MNDFSLRYLQKEDYDKGYLDLLSQLTTVTTMDREKFCENLDKINETTTNIFVIEEENKIIATATLVFEIKFIHDCGKVAHLEDVVIDQEFRGCGLGKKLIESVIKIAKARSCYKIICNCSDNLINFYAKCGFERKNVQMAIYF